MHQHRIHYPSHQLANMPTQHNAENRFKPRLLQLIQVVSIVLSVLLFVLRLRSVANLEGKMKRQDLAIQRLICAADLGAYEVTGDALHAVNIGKPKFKLFPAKRDTPTGEQHVLGKHYTGSDAQAQVNIDREKFRKIRHPHVLQPCGFSTFQGNITMYFYVPEEDASKLLPFSQYLCRAPQHLFNKTMRDFADLATWINDHFFKNGVIIDWGRNYTQDDQDCILINPDTGKLYLYDWVEGTEYSQRPFVDGMNNIRRDLRKHPVMGLKLKYFQDEWNSEEGRRVEDMIHLEGF